MTEKDNMNAKANESAEKGSEAANDATASGAPANSAPASNEVRPSAANSPRKRSRKWPIVAGVVAAIVIVAGAGFYAWHEQPSFCGAICHTPMDGYLETYEAQPGQAALDKYGNDVADASGMLAAVHRADADTTSMGCHVPTLGEQLAEGASWVSGGYDVYDNETYGASLEEKTLSQLTAARGIDTEEFCLNSGCHLGDDGQPLTRSDLVIATSDMTLNPHIAQHGELQCTDCHKAHRASVLNCTKCHEDAEVPAGWLGYEDAKTVK